MYSFLYYVLQIPTEVSAISVSVSDIIVEGSPSPTHTAHQRYVPPKNRYVGNPLLPVYGLSAHRDYKNCSRCGGSPYGWAWCRIHRTWVSEPLHPCYGLVGTHSSSTPHAFCETSRSSSVGSIFGTVWCRYVHIHPLLSRFVELYSHLLPLSPVLLVPPNMRFTSDSRYFTLLPTLTAFR